MNLTFSAPWHWKPEKLDGYPIRIPAQELCDRANYQITGYAIRRYLDYNDPRDVAELMGFSERLFSKWSQHPDLLPPNLLRGVPRGQTVKVLVRGRTELQEMKEWQLYRELGYPLEDHRIRATRTGYITCTGGTLEEIQALKVAIKKAGFFPSRELDKE